MSVEFANYQPEAWQENGLLIHVPMLKAKKSRRATSWNTMLSLSLSAVAVVVGSQTLAAGGALADAPVVQRQRYEPDRADLRKSQRDDADVVDPAYWNRLASGLSRLRALPEDVEGADFDPLI